ncbi:MAG: hypothetical protein R3F42_14395 [Pseudomonadota bacterium]
MPAIDRPVPKHRFACLLCCALLGITAAVRADYKADIGYTRLSQELGANTPDGSGVPVTQAEAATAVVPIGLIDYPVYLPDGNTPEFAGKTIIARSGIEAGTYSAHATNVGKTFYGSTSSIAPGILHVDAIWADHWLQSGFLNYGANARPLISSSRIANHSWIADANDPAINSELLRRADWAIATDEYINCVGIKNTATVNQPILSGAYNVIAVGKSDGLNGIGTTAVDADYVAGRARPELVAPKGTSSNAVPVVAAAAALLLEYGSSNPGLATDPVQASTTNRNGDTIYNTGRSEVIKAVLMAGADRSTANTSAPDISDYRADPLNRTGNGLDRRFGAGQVNIYNSFKILQAGEQNSNEDLGAGSIGSAGFDYDPSFGGAGASNSTASYHFATGAGQVLLATTLAWNININAGNGPNFTGSATRYDLDLYLYDITGTPVPVASSASLVDNTETIWTILPAGRQYRLEVVPKPGQGIFAWDYALAWRMTDLIDTDGDGIPDITDTDDDNDGLSDSDELAVGTDPLDADSDNDLVMDGTEILAGTNPLLASDFPVWGDINSDGSVDNADVLLATRAAAGLLTLDAGQLARGNVAPLVNGIPQTLPTDTFNAADLLLIQRKAQGVIAF